ncbi:MAG TPA: hypothetical protein PKO06_02085 [Candidatus Ozemobacteraceae bacterium]|nr:hypothetical protein [Candidatus Ozemobacteraceae bacterium]
MNHRIRSVWLIRSSIVLTVLAVICLSLAVTAPAAAEGYWELVDTKLIDKTQREGTWIKVRRHTDRYVEYEGVLPGSAPKVYRAEWNPPARILIPDGQVLTAVAAIIVSVPPALNHDAGLDVGCCFEHTGIGPGVSSGSGIGGAFAKFGGRAPGKSSDKKIIKAPKKEFGDKQGRMVFNVSVGNGFDNLGATFVYQWKGGPAPKPGVIGGDDQPDDQPEDQPEDKNTDNTAWSVGHPVPWVFHPDGTIDAKGLWNGTWVRSGNDYTVTIEHMGVKDTFTVRFSADGRSFTAYKDGQTYRQGLRR